MATHLTERVLPRAPYRQWVLTFLWRYRLLLARRPTLVSLALKLFLRSLFAWQARAARARGIRGRPGAVTFVQRFSSALRLNVHFHVLVPDGVFDDEGAFRALPAPTDDDVRSLLQRTAGRILRALEGELEGRCDDALTDLDAASLASHQSSLPTALHKAVREHKETFLEELRARSEQGLPRYAEEELSGYLRCGVLAHGFARVRCGECGHELLVGFSCKGRGICPSCTTRRAHDTAVHLRSGCCRVCRIASGC